uniref:Nuclear factor of activated T cells 3b n=1 Tax=Myripristis murdjan TaxID=586833 RepID=A0A667YAI2_9TELE
MSGRLPPPPPPWPCHHPCLSATNNYQHVGYQAMGPQYGSLGNPRAFDCPSIQITSIASHSHVEAGSSQDVVAGAEGGFPEASWSRDQLYLPLDACYRDAALSTSPCSSVSSRSWLSDRSSCESFSHIYDDVEGELNEAAARFTLGSPLTSPLHSPGCGGGAFGVEIWQQQYQHPLSPRQSPCPSPRTSITEENWLNPRPTSRPSSRPTSPGVKRRHSSADVPARSPSPHRSPSPTPGTSPRGSVTDETWVGSPGGTLGSLLGFGCQELDVPSKTRRTTGSQLGLVAGQGDSVLEELQAVIPLLDSAEEQGGAQGGLAELFLPVPSHFSWNKPKPGNPPLFRPSSPPPLDWPLPSQYEQWELKVEVQPKTHHRAHYETEGSRGSVKAAAGGHPVVKLTGYSDQQVSLLVFIGTADDRYVRPHSFYQVHRVTGKTVTTACQERIVGNYKVLEIPLLPENNMSASLDCAGILKLRNADIELKRGETDIGRKNTRVRLVFRVNVPQPGGRTVWLQTTSIPVECSQRSAQELPQVESFSPASCSADGGQEMIIRGPNISTQSKVIFMEKGPDGRSLWEVDVKVVPEKSSEASVVVEIPPYHKATSCPVQVQFYVTNGKRRRSLTQSFTYLPAARRLLLASSAPAAPLVKQERWEVDFIPHNPPVFRPAPSQPLSCPDTAYYDSCELPVHCGPPHLLHQHLPSPDPLDSLLDSNRQPGEHRLSFQPVARKPDVYAPPAPLTSSVPPHVPDPQQTSAVPPQSSSAGPGGEQAPSLGSRRAVLPGADPQKAALLTGTRGGLNIKQEPGEKSSLECVGLQEITLDDGRKLCRLKKTTNNIIITLRRKLFFILLFDAT